MRIESSVRGGFARQSGGGFLPGSGPGFAELIEAGRSVKAIVAHRALRFSDVGVLGVHNPIGDLVGDIAGGDGAGQVRSDPVGPVERPEWNQARLLSLEEDAPDLAQLSMQANDASALSASRLDGERVPSERGEAGRGTRIDIGTSSMPPLLALPMAYLDRASPQASKKVESNLGVPSEPAFVSIAYPPSGETFRIQLLSTAQGVVVMAEGFALEPQDSASIDDLAKAVAADFGVTIRRVMIGRNAR